MANPNANAAAITSAAVALLEYLLAKYAGVHLSQYYATTIVAGAAYLVLLVGRDGIKGLFKRVWNGSKAAWGGKAA